MSWGRQPQCGGCGECARCERAAYMRRWYASKSMAERRAMREQRDAARVRAADVARHHAKKGDPDYDTRRRAVSVLNSAVRRGEIERGACEVCGDPDAHGHHDDYDLPLEVRWLCSVHHAAHHAEAV